MKTKIPTNEPLLDGNERKYLLDVLKRNWITAGGKYTREFEKNFAGFIGSKYALSCNSGTSALHLALVSLGIGQGDEVLIPNFTIISSASTVIWTGAKPVLVDVDDYFCIDPEKIEEKITKKTKAIMVVHMYGNPANMDKIMVIASKYRLYVIEDACMAHGAMVGNKRVGSIGDVGCFSFYSTKLMTTAEGGMVVTNNSQLTKRIQLLRDYASERPRFNHTVLGFNYRLSDLQSAIGLAQLEKINQKILRKRAIAVNYNQLLKSLSEVDLPKDPPWGKSNFWVYPLLVKKHSSIVRNQVINKLKLQGIESTPFFKPISQQPVFKKGKEPTFPDVNNFYPKSDDLAENGLYIPTGINLKLSQQKQVVSALKTIFKKN